MGSKSVREKLFTDEYFMKKALFQARKAFEKNEVPIGSLVVAPDGRIILGQAHNSVEKRKCQSAHAEILAINKACKKLGDWRLSGCTLYVTLEPCSMCMSLIVLSRISSVVFSLKSKIFGFSIDKCVIFEINRSPITVREGPGLEESLDLLKKFFKKQREMKSE